MAALTRADRVEYEDSSARKNQDRIEWPCPADMKSGRSRSSHIEAKQVKP
jgi:hypothetical protein